MKHLLTLMLLVVASGAQAAELDDATVTNFGTYGTGKIFVSLDKDIPDPNCRKNRFDVEGDKEFINLVSTIALTALSTGKKIKIRTIGCLGAYPTLDATSGSWIYIKK